ncbi:MAG: rhodanese-like domain-containing protein, partial [Actinomycetota bacterium]
MTSPMIEPDELADLHAAAAVQVVDCRFRLGEHGVGRLLFAEGHIPGARYLDLDDDLSAPMRDD